MKTIIKKSILLLVTGFFFTYNLNAKEKENPKGETILEANKVIKEQVKFPEVIKHIDQTEKVDVVFTVNEMGQVNLVVANTQNEQLKKTIESQFMKLKLANLKANNAYGVVFNFKTI